MGGRQGSLQMVKVWTVAKREWRWLSKEPPPGTAALEELNLSTFCSLAVPPGSPSEQVAGIDELPISPLPCHGKSVE